MQVRFLVVLSESTLQACSYLCLGKNPCWSQWTAGRSPVLEWLEDCVCECLVYSECQCWCRSSSWRQGYISPLSALPARPQFAGLTSLKTTSNTWGQRDHTPPCTPRVNPRPTLSTSRSIVGGAAGNIQNLFFCTMEFIDWIFLHCNTKGVGAIN